MMRNSNTQHYPKALKDLSHLSYSSISKFEQCPRSWASSYLYGKKSASGAAAKIGNAVHSAQEEVYKTGAPIHHQKLIERGVPEKEVHKVVNYQNRSTKDVELPSLVEQEYRIKIDPDMPEILMFIDRVVFTSETTVTIIDHKTNRSMEHIEEWKQKLQPNLYALGIRAHYPHITEIKFKVGYVMFDQDLEWVIDLSSANEVIERVRNAWARMVTYARGVDNVPQLEWFPETLGDGCNWCDLKKVCNSFQTEILAPFQPVPIQKEVPKEVRIKLLAEELHTLKAKIKREETYKEELEEELKELVPETIQIDEYTIKISVGNSREINFLKFYQGLFDVEKHSGLSVVEDFMKNSSELVKFQLGNFDKYVKGHEDLTKLAQVCTEKKPQKPSLSIIRS